MSQSPTVGRIVHVKNGQGQCRPGIITRVWSPSDPDTAIQLTVFPDGSNDGEPMPVKWVTSAIPEHKRPENIQPSWQHYHWPEGTEG